MFRRASSRGAPFLLLWPILRGLPHLTRHEVEQRTGRPAGLPAVDLDWGRNLPRPVQPAKVRERVAEERRSLFTIEKAVTRQIRRQRDRRFLVCLLSVGHGCFPCGVAREQECAN